MESVGSQFACTIYLDVSARFSKRKLKIIRLDEFSRIVTNGVIMNLGRQIH